LPSVIVEELGIEFPIIPESSRSLRHVVLKTASRIGGDVLNHGSSVRLVRALENVTFSLKSGDRLALVGHNGAGKSTLIRILAGIYEPSFGRLEVRGRIVSMFEIGAGLDEESTGYENIVIKGLMLGMPLDEIRRRAPEIADYSELGDYIHFPVRTYSSGMLLRLVFAIAVSVKGNVVLMDEWIAVGDTAFKKKSQKKLEEFTSGSGILVLASHDNVLLRDNCNLAMQLEHGHVVNFGTTEEVLAKLT
jgi:ABC-2 type transport system ATP-binding protein